MASNSKLTKRILILGSGFGGLYTALHLEKKFRPDAAVEMTLVNRENFFLFTPMLHEVAAGDLDLTHIVNPVRKLLRRLGIQCGTPSTLKNVAPPLPSSRIKNGIALLRFRCSVAVLPHDSLSHGCAKP